MLQAAGPDFTLPEHLAFAALSIPQPGDILLVSYRVPTDTTTATLPTVLCFGKGPHHQRRVRGKFGTCAVPANALNPVRPHRVQFDYEHQGTSTGFTFELRWGATSVVQRSVDAGEQLISGKLEAAIAANGTQVSAQSWGGTAALATGVVNATDNLSGGITVNFLGNLAEAGTDSLTLRQFMVIRYQGQ